MAEGESKFRIKMQDDDKFVDPRKLLKKIQDKLGPSEYKIASRLPVDEQINILKSYFKLKVIESES